MTNTNTNMNTPTYRWVFTQYHHPALAPVVEFVIAAPTRAAAWEAVHRHPGYPGSPRDGGLEELWRVPRQAPGA
jgi:hypothetical protein